MKPLTSLKLALTILTITIGTVAPSKEASTPPIKFADNSTVKLINTIMYFFDPNTVHPFNQYQIPCTYDEEASNTSHRDKVLTCEMVSLGQSAIRINQETMNACMGTAKSLMKESKYMEPVMKETAEDGRRVWQICLTAELPSKSKLCVVFKENPPLEKESSSRRKKLARRLSLGGRSSSAKVVSTPTAHPEQQSSIGARGSTGSIPKSKTPKSEKRKSGGVLRLNLFGSDTPSSPEQSSIATTLDASLTHLGSTSVAGTNSGEEPSAPISRSSPQSVHLKKSRSSPRERLALTPRGESRSWRKTVVSSNIGSDKQSAQDEQDPPKDSKRKKQNSESGSSDESK